MAHLWIWKQTHLASGLGDEDQEENEVSTQRSAEMVGTVAVSQGLFFQTLT